MKLYSWNVNGLRAVWNKGKLEEFIDQQAPDILCLQETKAKAEQSPLKLPAYEKIYCSAKRPGYSGTAILSKTKPLSISCNFDSKLARKYNFTDSYGDSNNEGRVLTAEWPDFYLVNVYTPNSKGDLGRLEHRHNVWDPAFKEHCQQLAKTKPVLMTGDFNVAHQEIDLARAKENVGKHGFTDQERTGFSKLLAAGFVDSFRALHPQATDTYSWWTAWGQSRANNVGWRIDYWLVSEELMPKVVGAQVHADIFGSDHCPISLELKD